MVDVFGGLVNLCTALQTRSKSANEEENLQQYRAIVGGLLAFDHIAPLGAFHAKAAVKTLQAVSLLANAQPRPSALINLLKYGAKHYKDANTVKGITAVVG